MKRLTCEMCGSTDLIKQDGLFVCQSCGCRYSVEEAKKMMIDGVVDVQGTVKVDNSAFVQKYLANARRAKEKEDWEETEKYYNMVEQNDPNNIEAIFYSAYGKAKTALTDADIYKRQATFKVLKNCISILDDKYSVGRREENEVAIKASAIDLGSMICSEFVFTEWKNGNGWVTKTNKGETIAMFGGLLDAFKETIDNIEKIDDQPYLHEASANLYKVAMRTGYWSKSLLQGWIDEEEIELDALRRNAISTYWDEHKIEKDQLESELASIKDRVKSLCDKIESLPEVAQVSSIRSEIADQKKLLDGLGLFKGKEKEAIQRKISALSKELEVAQEKRVTSAVAYEDQLAPLYSRIDEIDNELTKDR